MTGDCRKCEDLEIENLSLVMKNEMLSRELENIDRYYPSLKHGAYIPQHALNSVREALTRYKVLTNRPY